MEEEKNGSQNLDQKSFARNQLSQITQQILELQKKEQFFKTQLGDSFCRDPPPFSSEKDFYTQDYLPDPQIDTSLTDFLQGQNEPYTQRE